VEAEEIPMGDKEVDVIGMERKQMTVVVLPLQGRPSLLFIDYFIKQYNGNNNTRW